MSAFKNELEAASGTDAPVRAVIGERLRLDVFTQLSGNLAGYPFVKVVVDRVKAQIHFINNARYSFHADYISECLLGMTRDQLEADIDGFNDGLYRQPDRRFCIGILALHKRDEKCFFSLETVEVDTMDATMLKFFFAFVKENVDPEIPLLFKPANHPQEAMMADIPLGELPRVFAHELFASARFIALHPGVSRGRLRAFRTDAEYKAAFTTIEWHDIIVMHRVPDDIPRVSGVINAHHTTPLSHTNVLASGWQIPNAIQLGIFDRIRDEKLDGQWVEYKVEVAGTQVELNRIERPAETLQRPSWTVQHIQLEEPEVRATPIASLDKLRMSDRYKYGTKAANLGELRHLLSAGSERLLGFYRVRRPPRENLLPHLARYLDVPETADLARESWRFLKSAVQVPRGIAIPFSVQQQFLESSPRIQQAIGKLKMALELNAREIDPLCLTLQKLIRATRFPEHVREAIDTRIASELSGVSTFVVRSSSNAEDLENFSAAGIYESINHVTTADNIFSSIREVWASLVSPRSVRLRQQVGISLDACYMGVIVQEEVISKMGGVLVTTNPIAAHDFRNVFINVSAKSAVEIVKGAELPFQYLYNTVEGGGRTISLGDATEDMPEEARARLQKLAFAGRLLQSHFSPDYTFSAPVDIEWLANDEGLFILQLRPYAK